MKYCFSLTSKLKISALAGILVLPLTPLPLYADNPNNLEGIYSCAGEEPDTHKSYSTALKITKTQDTYDFQWITADPEQQYSGTGLFMSAHNIIAAVFQNSKIGAKSGIIVYELKQDGRLDGTFTYSKTGAIGQENCFKEKAQ